ncbi:MAG: molybdate ABC transporter substrate-binding protein [Rhodobacteraceae bacterium]|nr:molybdate ABC transporter substrate-binding protein [Paracoccaceae bacterium]
MPLLRTALTLLCGIVLAATLVGGTRAQAEQVTVFAAASLKNALEEVANGFEAQSGYSVVFSFAGSSTLARQIQLGAPADIFISANSQWMDVLQEDGLIQGETRFDLAGNRLALIATARVEMSDLGPETDLSGMLQGGYLAMGLVDAVPAGIYGKQALQNLGLWSQVQTKVAQSDNVRAALALVASGEAPLGIVYATDAAVEDAVQVAALFPADSHSPIVYPAAQIADDTDASVALMAFLQSDWARTVLERHGFTHVGAPG